MDPTQYPRPDFTPGGTYPKDKTWGIVIMALSALGVCCGLAAAGIGGALGVAAASTAAGGGASNRDAAAGLGIGGGIVALLGFALLATSLAQVAGGYGIMNSRRWGFNLTLAFAAISVLLSIPQVLHGTGVVGVVLNGVIAWYCWSRLSGKEGPTPV